MIHPAPPPTLPAATSPAQPIASVRWDGDAPVVIDQRIVGCDRVAANGDTANLERSGDVPAATAR